MAAYEEINFFSENHQVTDLVIKNFCNFPYLEVKKTDVNFKIYGLFSINICLTNDDYISVYIQKSRANHELYATDITCIVNVVDVEGRTKWPKSFGSKFGGTCYEVTECEWEKYIDRKTLLKNSDEIIVEDQLSIRLEICYTILVDIRYPHWLVYKDDIEYTSPGSRYLLETTISQLGNMKLDPQQMTEKPFTIYTKDGKFYDLNFDKAGQSLGCKVCAASPVFSAMIYIPMIENKRRNVFLEDINYETLMNFLTYVSQEILLVETLKHASELYEMADKYQVLGLMTDCRKYMMDKATFENIFNLLYLANLHCDDILKANIANFLRNKEIILTKLNDSKATTLGDSYTWTTITKQSTFVGFNNDVQTTHEPNYLSVRNFEEFFLLFDIVQNFSIHNLKQDCLDYIELNMTTKYVNKLLNLAIEFGDENLKDSVESFKNRNFLFPEQPDASCLYPELENSLYFQDYLIFKEPEIQRESLERKEIVSSNELDFYK